MHAADRYRKIRLVCHDRMSERRTACGRDRALVQRECTHAPPGALSLLYGAPGEIRTPDHLVRSQVLYPTELRAHEGDAIIEGRERRNEPIEPIEPPAGTRRRFGAVECTGPAARDGAAASQPQSMTRIACPGNCAVQAASSVVGMPPARALITYSLTTSKSSACDRTE